MPATQIYKFTKNSNLLSRWFICFVFLKTKIYHPN